MVSDGDSHEPRATLGTLEAGGLIRNDGGGPNAPSRLRRAGNLARRFALWGMRPFGAHGDRDADLIASMRNVQAQLVGLDERIETAQHTLEGRLGDLEAELSHVVAGIEMGSVPARQTTYLGHPFVYPYDSAIGQLIQDGCEWDALLRTVVAEILPAEDPVIWEVGSNIGSSLRQILVAKPRASVLAFEPSSRFLPFLERNVELAGTADVEVRPLFIGRKPGGSKWLYSSGTTAGTVKDSNSLIQDTVPPGFELRDKQLVHTTTLDDVQSDRRPVDFLKVDTDGFDFEVLRGGATMLERDRPVVYFELLPGLAELVPSPVAESLAWMQELGYRQLVCFDPRGRLVGKTDDPAQAVAWAEDNLYCDVLTCFQGSAAKARLARIEFPSSVSSEASAPSS